MHLTDFKVLTFDCYGTLIDWESGMVDALRPLTERAVHKLNRDGDPTGARYPRVVSAASNPAKLYCDILPIVFKRLAEQWGVDVTHEECAAYGRSVGDWPAFEDSPGALRYLKKFYKLVVLSNVDNRSFEGSRKRLQADFDAVITAEDAGSYKPDARTSTTCWSAWRPASGARRSPMPIFCILRRACFTTTSQRTNLDSRHAGSTADISNRVMVPR